MPCLCFYASKLSKLQGLEFAHHNSMMNSNNTPDLDFIHRFVPTQSTLGQSTLAPTLLLLHGTGGSENDLLALGQSLAPGAALLNPRGKVLENGMPRFFRRLAEGVFDLEDLQFRTHELADFVEQAASVYQFASQNVWAMGYSNGANIAASTLLLRPATLAGAILLHPMVPLVPDPLPNLTGKQIFIGAGQHDPLVPTTETERLAHLLQSAGATVTSYWHSAGHSLTQDEVVAAKQWWNKVNHAL
jgi:predicted esterase